MGAMRYASVRDFPAFNKVENNTCKCIYFVLYSIKSIGIKGYMNPTNNLKPTYKMMCCCMAMCRLRGGGCPPV